METSLRIAVVLTLVLAPFLPPLAPTPADAQEPPATADRTHVVRSGDTLAGLAREYLGSPAHWERIFEANRDVISDPHRILPGMELAIPGLPADPDDPGVQIIRGADDDALADITGLTLDEPLPEVVADTFPRGQVEDRRDLMRSQPFQARDVPTSDRPRTIFHGAHESASRSPTRPGVLVSPREEMMAVSRSAFNSAAWVVPLDTDPVELGRVVDFEGDRALGMVRTTVQLYDDVLLELDDPGQFDVGDQLLAYSDQGRIDDMGRIKAPSGVLELTRLEGNGAVARVTGSFDRFELGHRVTRPRTFPLVAGVHPEVTDMDVSATVVAFRDRKEIYLPGDQAFLDRGTDAGLAVGDELVGLVGDRDGRQGRRVARFQVIWAEEDYSTVRLLTSESPTAVAPGLRVVLDRKMP